MSVIVLLGGLMGFMKAKSKASLISGVISAILLGAAFAAGLNGKPSEGIIASFVIYSLLDVVFAMRLKKTKKFMPAGLILIFCCIGQVLDALALKG